MKKTFLILILILLSFFAFLTYHALTPIKIDLVYTWVDGNDKQWQEKKQFWLDKEKNPSYNGTANARFRDNEELRYSLRSVEQNAPWINHIFIVTDGQIPKWLNTKHPKITIVSHTDIFPEGVLPVFNSNTIESRLPFIPKLSEYFLYANDDMFFGAPVPSEFFFDTNGIPKTYILPRDREYIFKSRHLYFQLIANMYAKVEQLYFVSDYFMPSHNIDAYRKSFFKENLKELFPDDFPFNRFRKQDDFQRIAINLMDNAKNRVQLLPKKTTIKQLNLPCKTEFLHILRKLDNVFLFKPCLFCLNDFEDKSPEEREKTTALLKLLFPNKSTFEID